MQILYMIVWICRKDKWIGDLNNFLRSDLQYKQNMEYLCILHNNVYGVKVNRVSWFEDFYDGNEIGMIQFSKNANFPKNSFTVNLIIEDAIKPIRNTEFRIKYFLMATFFPVGL